eukprot:CAMPEP_0196720688 /NCGR_PEP_ID=MMETSP1091-20130531/3420_1 /TAXON_ID=302021 /ORGANISM="Rhodomonas sp., Strain CCMP768" /LENGTH=178 /DNA_ID=CAMNT_0042061991 /DNA_START=256 /DNA_END=792 /DNA_ORIENTATION=+
MTATVGRGKGNAGWDDDWQRFRQDHPEVVERFRSGKVYKLEELREMCGPTQPSVKGTESANSAISRLRRTVASDRTSDRKDEFRKRWTQQRSQRSAATTVLNAGAQSGTFAAFRVRSVWSSTLAWAAVAFAMITTVSLTITLSLATLSPGSMTAFATAQVSGPSVHSTEAAVSRSLES